MLKILYKDSELVAVEKPAGFYVHPSENGRKIPTSQNILYILKKQLGSWIYPVHRLDRATSGVLIFALNSKSAGLLCGQFAKRSVEKIYVCVVRGWTEKTGIIDYPLKSEKNNLRSLDAKTKFFTLRHLEISKAVGKRYQAARYSLVLATPLTGRFHQLRRHFAHLSHPIIGDSVHGDGAHNHFFRDELKIPSLLLKAYSLKIKHPVSQKPIEVRSRWTGTWHQVFDLFGVCPFLSIVAGDLLTIKTQAVGLESGLVVPSPL